MCRLMPLPQPLAVQPVHRLAQGLEAAGLADLLGLDLQGVVEIDVVDHRGPPDLLLRVPPPALAVGEQIPARGQVAADLGLGVLERLVRLHGAGLCLKSGPGRRAPPSLTPRDPVATIPEARVPATRLIQEGKP